MHWKQFFTAVDSLNSEQTRKYIADENYNTFTVLDVRQPNEYENGHIPGARLIPLPDLTERLNEIDPARPTLVYCVIGGRSRVAAQIQAGKGFDTVEGGLTTKEYTDLFSVDWEPVTEITGLAMSIEAQALDLYVRTAARNDHLHSEKPLLQIADEERAHLKELGRLIESI